MACVWNVVPPQQAALGSPHGWAAHEFANVPHFCSRAKFEFAKVPQVRSPSSAGCPRVPPRMGCTWNLGTFHTFAVGPNPHLRTLHTFAVPPQKAALGSPPRMGCTWNLRTFLLSAPHVNRGPTDPQPRPQKSVTSYNGLQYAHAQQAWGLRVTLGPTTRRTILKHI